MKGNLKEKKKTKQNKKRSTTGSKADCKDFRFSFPSTFGNIKKHYFVFPSGKRAEYNSFHLLSTTQLLLIRSQSKYLKLSARTRHRQMAQKTPTNPATKKNAQELQISKYWECKAFILYEAKDSISHYAISLHKYVRNTDKHQSSHMLFSCRTKALIRTHSQIL